MDGHSGIENKQVNKATSGHFQLILSGLKQSSREFTFILHATSNTCYTAGLQPQDFLQRIGLSHFSGECQFYRDSCFYREIATVRRGPSGLIDQHQVQSVHRGFEKLANNFNHLYELFREQRRILQDIGLDRGSESLFGAPAELEISETDIPPWVEGIKPRQLVALEEKFEETREEINALSGYLPLVYAKGPTLTDAVLKALRLFGLEAESTKSGFTIDIFANTPDGSKLGFEVTGTKGPIRKANKHLTQVLEFERIKEHGEKTVLVANTFNDTPTREREQGDDFTSDVVDFLSPYPILLMTGWDLYRLVCDVLEEKKDDEAVVELLLSKSGVFEYE